MSGDTLTSAQAAASRPRMAMDDWVRARARTVPARSPAQLRQLQFHWGNPPPAAAPSTLIFMGRTRRGREENRWTQPAYAGRRHKLERCDQRLLMYIVISMPKRMSIASGVSHFIMWLLVGWTIGLSSGS